MSEQRTADTSYHLVWQRGRSRLEEGEMAASMLRAKGKVMTADYCGRRAVLAIVAGLFVVAQLCYYLTYHRLQLSATTNHPPSSLTSFPPPRCSPSKTTQQCLTENAIDWARSYKAPGGRKRCEDCPPHSFCFMEGTSCPCWPGWKGTNCDVRGAPEDTNPWYTVHCPNLLDIKGVTYNPETPLSALGGEYYDKRASSSRGGPCAPLRDQPACAYLCYSHIAYGVAAVPSSLWRTAQQAEAALWKSLGGWNSPSNDRAPEHWRGFANFACIRNASLGRTIEVGAGPWTQVKGMLHVRPDLAIEEFTIFEPGANGYIKDVASCSYRAGKLEYFERSRGAHSFPLVIKSQGGELLRAEEGQYDTLVSINVLEHVQDAFAYLSRLHAALRRGGTLIFHERYYDDVAVLRGDLWHPVRIKQAVLDTFLSAFSIQFNNCHADYDGRSGEKGYYVIATKL